MRSARAPLFLLTAVLLTGCPPDLSGYTIHPGEQVDGGGAPPIDGGGRPNPIDLGTPCPDPHLVMSARTSSSAGSARLVRFDPSSRTPCRASSVLEVQAAFGTEIADVAGWPGVGEVLALDQAVLALDAEGFPRWRYQPFDEYYFVPAQLAVVPMAGGPRVALLWYEQAGREPSGVLFFDGNGVQRGAIADLPFSHYHFTASPDGSSAILMSPNYGPVRRFAVTEGTTALREADGTDLFDIDSAGQFEELDADVASARLAVALTNGVASWTFGGPAPAPMTCPSYCTSFDDAAVDPTRADSVFAICSGNGDRHLVHVTPGGCELMIDGTTLGTRDAVGITLVRTAL